MNCFCLLVWLVVVFVCLFVYLFCLFCLFVCLFDCLFGCFALLCFALLWGRGREKRKNVRPTSARVYFLHGVEAKTSKIVIIACLLGRKVKMRISGPKSTKFARRPGETPRSENILEIFRQEWHQRHEKARGTAKSQTDGTCRNAGHMQKF